MELEMDVEDLLNKRKLESDRIEFKTGWNPDDIYHSVCAFANDYNNDGGGYIVVGVEEENGVAKRPVKGLHEYNRRHHYYNHLQMHRHYGRYHQDSTQP